jgi:hypothetical protein
MRVAQRLLQEATMALAWIATRLQMGTNPYLAHLQRNEKQHETIDCPIHK